MERVVFVALLVSHVCCEMNLDKFWTSWKAGFNKEYNSEREEAYRRELWEKNVLEVRKHNEEAAAGNHTYTMGTNQFSDMTRDEVNKMLRCVKTKNLPHQDANGSIAFPSRPPIPSKVNWTSRGYVTPVQNQGSCGSCWAFSAVGALEAQMKMKMKTNCVVPLSIQNLVDCSSKEGNYGCCGGFMTNAFTYIVNNGGIDSAHFYPYKEEERTCSYSPRRSAGNCTGFQVLPSRNETALLHAVARIGPVSVGINAIHKSFLHYHGGIYKDPACNQKNINHAVLVVGYGRERTQYYWLVKNSWGTGWGESGYIRVARNTNQCGIAQYAVYPTV